MIERLLGAALTLALTLTITSKLQALNSKTLNSKTLNPKLSTLNHQPSKAMQKLSSKEIIAIWFAVVSAAISITALWMPPQGIIDQSVLILIGQFLLFIATLTGVDGALTRLSQMRQKHPPTDG